MQTLVITDVHGNLPALEAVLAAPDVHACERIISLGDQVNFGPQPREVMRRLEQLGAVMLRGNHEERLLRAEDAAFAGYNWALQRWTHSKLHGVKLDHPLDLAEGCKLFTHGTPGQPFHLIQAEEVPALLETLPEGITHLFSGHNHHPWYVEHGGRVACNPGALGMAEDNLGSHARYLIIDESDGHITLNCRCIPYDTTALARAYVATGCARSAPEMTRIVLHTMITGEYQATLRLVHYVASLGDLGDEECWKRADRDWHWREPLSTRDYWNKLEEELL